MSDGNVTALHTDPGQETQQERPASAMDNVSTQRLKSYIERVERLEEEKKGLADDIKEVYAEAKAMGFDPKVMRQVIKLRAQDNEKRQEQDALLETYKAALGIA